MINKPMLSVERELLERISFELPFSGTRLELRALLDNQVLESQYDGMTQAQAQAVSDGVDEILHGKTAQPYQRYTILKECNVKSSPASGARINSIAKPITRRICHGCVGLPRDVFCPVCDDEQPATVADHPQCEECKGWGYHENHHEGGGTECGECGGSGNATVAVVMTGEQILEAMRQSLTDADGGYVFDTAKDDVIAAGRALLEVAKLNGVKP